MTRQESERGRVVIGMDAHKRSVTIELMDPEETVHGGGRPGTDVVGPQGHERAGEISAVSKQVPEACESSNPLHRFKINELGAKNFVGRMIGVDHAPFRVVPDDGRASQPL